MYFSSGVDSQTFRSGQGACYRPRSPQALPIHLPRLDRQEPPFLHHLDRDGSRLANLNR
jgi:hypothetical protein